MEAPGGMDGLMMQIRMLKMENKSRRVQLEMERLEKELIFMTMSSASLETSTLHQQDRVDRGTSYRRRQSIQYSTPMTGNVPEKCDQWTETPGMGLPNSYEDKRPFNATDVMDRHKSGDKDDSSDKHDAISKLKETDDKQDTTSSDKSMAWDRFVTKRTRFQDHDDNEVTESSKSEKHSVYMKPATFDGTGSWSDYKVHFEACSEINKWTDAKKGLYLAVKLRGTADITVHERQADGGLKELHKASGGAWGGTKVDEELYKLLIRIIGGPVYQKFAYDNKSDHLDLQRELETKKRTITPNSSGKITIKVPVQIMQTYKEEMGEDIKEAVEGSPFSGKITWAGDKIRIDSQIFKDLFKPCTDKIVAHIKDLLKDRDVQGTNIFLMVGGFSEFAMVQDAAMKALPKSKVIIPAEPGLTVLKGAVIFGHRPVAITSRVSKYTYGINISPPFDPAVHPDDHRVSVGGIDRCRDVFKKYIHEAETVKVGEARSGKHVTLKANQKEMLLKVFASPKRDPMLVDEDETEYLGKVVVNLPDCEDKIRVEVKMMFGETELTVEAEELYFDFLRHVIIMTDNLLFIDTAINCYFLFILYLCIQKLLSFLNCLAKEV